MKKSITVIACRPYKIDRKEDGQTYTGYVVDGFTEKEAIRFSSDIEHECVDADEYDPALAEEIDLSVNLFEGKKKYKEIVPDDAAAGSF